MTKRYKLTYLWICGAFLYLFSNAQKVIVPGTIFSELQYHYGATAPMITGLGSAFMYAYAISQLLVGLLVDRFSGLRVMLFGGILLCLGTIISGLSSTLWMLYMARILVGFGAASVFLSIAKETSRIYPEKFVSMFGLLILFGYMGGILANAPFIAGVAHFGWQWMIVAVGIATLVFYLVFVFIKQVLPSPVIVEEARLDISRFFTVLKSRSNRHMLICSACTFSVYMVIQSVIGKKFLEDYAGLTATGAGGLMTTLMAIGVCNALLSPALSTWMGNRRQIFMRIAGTGTFSSIILIMFCLVFGIRHSWLIGGSFCLMAVSSTFSPIVVSLFKEINKPDIWGAALSMYMFLAYIITALLGNAVGMLMHIYKPVAVEELMIYSGSSYLAAFLPLLLTTAFALFSCFKIKETYGINVAEQKN